MLKTPSVTAGGSVEPFIPWKKYNFISYDRFDLKTTFQPDQIPKLFPDVEFKKLKHPSLMDAKRENYFYFGKSVHS